MIKIIGRGCFTFVTLAFLVGSSVDSLAKAADIGCIANCPGATGPSASDPMLVIADRLETVVSKFGVVGPDGRFDRSNMSADKAAPRLIGASGGPATK